MKLFGCRQARRPYLTAVLAAVTAASLMTSGRESAAQIAITADPGVKPNAPLDPNRPLPQELVTSTNRNLLVVAVGSLTISSPGGALPAFDPAVLSLLTGSDTPTASTVTVGELDTSIFDVHTFKGYPYAWNAAPTPSAAPEVARNLKASGFDLFALANGHALDWGIDGMQATSAALDAAGLIHAGTGLNEGLARSAQYYEEPRGRGRIALVSAAAAFRPTSDALHAEGAAPGRPGVSGLEVDSVRLVSPDQLQQLQQVACKYEYYLQSHDCTPTSVSASVTTLGSTFESTTPSHYYTTDHRLNRVQAQDLLRFVREGREHADFLVVSLHADQVASARSNAPQTPQFLEDLAHVAVDSGADIVMNTGRPTLGPIEIYRAEGRPPRPIFYGLGSFCWSPGLAPTGADPTAMWSIITRTQIDNKQLDVEIYPIDLSPDATHSDGWPRLADKALAAEILQRLIKLSAPFGTLITIIASGSTYRGSIREEDVGRSKMRSAPAKAPGQ
jgi:poly-gamma-glutamate capsule biosynthesis protein CapA/YwtB (metallophosphatase superfamily)